MTTKQFIEKAIEGGYKINPHKVWGEYHFKTKEFLGVRGNLESVFLDPKAWEAVGKVEGWEKKNFHRGMGNETPHWKWLMHQMIDALCNGKTIEQFLSEL